MSFIKIRQYCLRHLYILYILILYLWRSFIKIRQYCLRHWQKNLLILILNNLWLLYIKLLFLLLNTQS